MSNRATIYSKQAPEAIGTYSHAVKMDNTVYLSGQIPLDPGTMELVEGGFEAQAAQVSKNLSAVCAAAASDLNNVVTLNLYLTDLDAFRIVNEVRERHFKEPYPARAASGVSQLPKGALIEADGIMVV